MISPPSPFARTLRIQLSDDVTLRPGDHVSVDIEVGTPPDAAHSRITVRVNHRKVAAATGFDFGWFPWKELGDRAP